MAVPSVQPYQQAIGRIRKGNLTQENALIPKIGHNRIAVPVRSTRVRVQAFLGLNAGQRVDISQARIEIAAVPAGST